MLRLFFLLFHCISLAIFGIPTIEKEPLVHVLTPDSVLSKVLPTEDIRFAGTTPRYSTCSGVAWGKNSRTLFTVNMQASIVDQYSFDPDTFTISHTRRFTNDDGMHLKRPENIAISPGKNLVSIPNMSTAKVNIYALNDATLSPFPLLSISVDNPHGCSFSNDGKILAIAALAKGVHFFRKNGNAFILSQKLGLPFSPLKPKSAVFSPEDAFVIIGSCIELSPNKQIPSGQLAVYRFNSKRGVVMGKPLSIDTRQLSIETISFHPSGDSFFAVDQVNSKVYGYIFNNQTGRIEKQWIALDEESGLNIPHGISFSPDGKFVAVTNYGDDSFCIYSVINN